MTTRQSPAVDRRRLASELRRHRERAGLTTVEVGARLACSQSRISRIERARIGVGPCDVRDLCALYGVSGEETEFLVGLAGRSRQKAWWSRYHDVIDGPYVEIEAGAERLRAYDALWVPDLLQTPAYARAVVRAARPGLPVDEVERRVEFRMARQRMLTDEQPLRAAVVLDEGVLHRAVGGPGVMGGQLRHLREVCGLPTVALRVLPFAVAEEVVADTGFVLLDVPGLATRPTGGIVFRDVAGGGVAVEGAESARHHTELFDRLWSAALPETESLAFVDAVAGRFEALARDETDA
ncbi:Helix-turn-helix domain-containing protein [Streptoalloteichus tenebrarius]|uniref:Helix-turn-helix domain-containing protein n=1 Tax=Streptoalloteichus tenebrarius (strain ATCC 17920 / DSM 40477 / JCM 4838 / CBS 697.72 / NBRC 16177 / NCIMB 11028 / NRRL B-12390 / A12253. 1 / ISP 5477) TaxID=1933 RepID=A0ABT1HXF7_STRSD|nr:helix-turn-helix transcriptional regulator [Streptoalloteichus tenebrarius]MCP2260181.1 Helix-turn-helix domain-containing protein [Streptoalloteichus tenebrarius]BFF02616.1 helix-turn-helix transcriptional regulator [Streptoalloteichus tenebrarius]